MRLPFFVFIIMCAGLLGLSSYNLAYAFFSDAALSTTNTFQASAAFPTAIPTPSPTSAPTATPSPTPTSAPTATPTPSSIANHLVINEVLYDISNDQQISGQGGSNRGEWVEVYNPTVSSVSLSGWTIADGDSTETLTGTLNASSFLIITGATEAEFEAVWGDHPSAIYVQAAGGTIGNGLANGGDVVTLKNGSAIVDSMSWGTDTTGFSSGCAASCPTEPTGQSLERNPIALDTDSAADFVVKNPPTPGL